MRTIAPLLLVLDVIRIAIDTNLTLSVNLASACLQKLAGAKQFVGAKNVFIPKLAWRRTTVVAPNTA